MSLRDAKGLLFLAPESLTQTLLKSNNDDGLFRVIVIKGQHRNVGLIETSHLIDSGLGFVLQEGHALVFHETFGCLTFISTRNHFSKQSLQP